MESAEQERTTVDVISADKKITLRATGTVTLFDGFLTLYLEGEDDAADDEGSRAAQGCRGRAAKVENVKSGPAFHRTAAALFRSQPGARSWKNWASAGLPPMPPFFPPCATAPMCGRIAAASIPEDKGRLVTTFLQSFFKRYVEYDFTADLEEKLDEVSAGDLDWKQLLRDFWKDFSAAVGETKDLKIRQVIDELDSVLGPHIFPAGEDGIDPRKCPNCENGRLNLKLGRFGAFVGCTNYPECKFTRQIGAKPGEGDAGPRELGLFPGTEDHGDAALRPLRALCAVGRRQEAQAQRPAQGHRSRRSGSGDGGQAVVAAARSGRASRRRQDDHGEFRPLRALCRP